MIREPAPACPGALLHLPGVGPRKEAALRTKGIETWPELARALDDGLPGMPPANPALAEALRAVEHAYREGDLRYLAATLHRSDHWRILHDFEPEAAYLDIETSGDQEMQEITTVVCLHREKVHVFTAEHSLDPFLDLLDDVRLFVTFNGASFDIPRLENHFHIPLRDIAHIDLRWVCYHAGLKGGLKDIERGIGLVRPADLIGTDGAEADWLWRRWKQTGNPRLLQRLNRYCAADVIGLRHLARWLIAGKTGRAHPPFEWTGLPPAAPDTPEPIAKAEPAPPASAAAPDPAIDRMRRRLRSLRRGEG